MRNARRAPIARLAFAGIGIIALGAGLAIGWRWQEMRTAAPPPTIIANPATAYPVLARGAVAPGADGARCGESFPPIRTGARETVLTGLAARAAGDVWAVGYTRDGDTARTLALHWDGHAWHPVPTPNHGPGINMLYGVAALAADDVWAAGTTGENALATLILHWDGRAWAIVPSPNAAPTNNILRGIAARQPNDVWAVGDVNVGEGRFQDLILHWDGHAWAHVAGPPGPAGFNILNGVTAVAADDAWAAGRDGAGLAIIHWDGHAWTPSPAPKLPLASELLAIAATGPRDAWAVGAWAPALAVHWDGTAWRLVPVPSPGGPNGALRGVIAPTAGQPWAVGDTAGPAPWLARGAAGGWFLAAGPADAPHAYLRAVATAPDGTVWAAGADHGADTAAPVGSLEGPGTGAALIVRRPATCGQEAAGTAAPAPPPLLLSSTVLQGYATGPDLVWEDVTPARGLYAYNTATGRTSLLTSADSGYEHLTGDGRWLAWLAGGAIAGLDLQTGEARTLRTLDAGRSLEYSSAIAVAGGTLYYTGGAPDVPLDSSGGDSEATPTPDPYEGGLFAYDLGTGQERRVAAHGRDPVAGDGLLLWTDGGIHLRYLDGHAPDRLLDSAAGADAEASVSYSYGLAGPYVAWTRRPAGGGLHLTDTRTGADRVLAGGPLAGPLIRGDVVAWTDLPADPYSHDPMTPWAIRAYHISTDRQTTVLAEHGGAPITAVALLDPPALAYRKGEVWAELYIVPLP